MLVVIMRYVITLAGLSLYAILYVIKEALS